MGHELKRALRASDVARMCGLELVGADVVVRSVAALSEAGEGTLCFAKAVPATRPPRGCIVIGLAEAASVVDTLLVTATPRLAFARVLEALDRDVGFVRPTAPPLIHPTARVSAHAALAPGVEIGAYSVVNHFVVLTEGVKIGSHCVIKSGAVIGEDGFGFERDENGLPQRLVHLGSVRIGDHVEIGSLTTVCRGTLADTIVEDHAKIDDHVHIAHNCRIGVGAMIIACAEVSGGCVVGRGAWIGPNASVLQQRKIGERALIGIGANVLKDVPDDQTVAGNPARQLLPK
jgi:UDP-3-O-[3-hydroxymyristoyl] glucosamine N-acyltransferase